MSLLHLTPQAEPLLPPPPAELAGRPRDGRRWKKWLGIAAGLWLLTGFYIVPADEQAVVTRLGRVVDPRVGPGIHVSLPWPLDRVFKLKVRQLQRQVIGGAPPDSVLGRVEPRTAQFLTGDQNIIYLRVAVQYSVSAPAEFLFTATDAPRTVEAAVESELSRRVANHTVDSVLTTDKVAIQEEVRGSAQRLIDAYGIGVVLASVSIESAVPPPEARDAFNDVASARADSARIVNESQGYANDLIPKARGEANQMLQAAQAYRLKKINEARGDADRFTQVAAEYARASDVNGRRLYAETMEAILPRIKKMIVDSRGNLDLTILRKGDPAPVKK